MKLKILLIFFICFIKSYSQEKDLTYFIEKARMVSPLLLDLKNQINSNSVDSLLARAYYKPQVNGNLSVNVAPTIDGFGYDTAITNGQVLSGTVGVNRKIIAKSSLNYKAESYKLIRDALVLNKKIAIRDLDKVVAVQYITASASLLQMDFYKKISSLLNQQAAILKKLTQNSIYKQTDYLIFSATLKQLEFTMLQSKQQYRNDLALLNYLSGEVDTTKIILKKPDLTVHTIYKGNKVFLQKFDIDSLKYQNQKQVIAFAYKPQLSLLADAGYLSSFADTPYKNFGFSVGLGLTVPIYDAGQRSLLHRKNDLLLQTNMQYKANFKRQYQQQLLMLDLKLKQYSENEAQLQSQLLISETLIDAYKKLLPSGDAQITDFTIAIQNLISINNAILQNNSSKLQTVNEINYWSKTE